MKARAMDPATILSTEWWGESRQREKVRQENAISQIANFGTVHLAAATNLLAANSTDFKFCCRRFILE